MPFLATLGIACLTGYLNSFIIDASKTGMNIIINGGSNGEDWVSVRNGKIYKLHLTIQRTEQMDDDLSSHSNLPSKWINAIAQAIYEFEDAIICPTSARNQQAPNKRPTSTSRFQHNALELEASRVEDKDAVIEQLRSSSSIGIALIGIVGLGKKSLAVAVADDPNIRDEFHSHVVVDLSTDLEAAARESSNENKKLLILLDGAAPMGLKDWDDFRSRLLKLNPESKVLITTEDPQVAVAANCTKYLLPDLPGEECISIISKTCDRAHIGLLLSAAREDFSGTMTRITSTGSLWEEPDLKTAVLNSRAVSLVLKDLTFKRCVSYCSLFPQGHPFKKEDWVLLWMAEGFFPAPETEKEYVMLLEKKTTEGFNELLSCSIFNLLAAGKDRKYAMHGLIYDLAQYVGSKTVYRMCIGVSDSAPPSNLVTESPDIRHLSVSCEKVERDEININRVGKYLSYISKNWVGLRTLVFVGDEIKEMINDKTTFFETLNRLRVLNLSGTKLTKISSYKMIQLRFLDLSDTQITVLPSLSTNLQLQVLKLNNCEKLKSLPENLINLTNLVSLQLNMADLKKPLAEIGKLKYLKSLDQFIKSIFIYYS